MKKRVLSALLALCMACTLAGNVWAAEETEPTPAPSAGVEVQTVEPQTVEPTPSAEPTQAPAPSPDATAEPEATPEPSAAPSAAPDATVAPTATPAPTEAPEATDAPAATATPDATAEPAATPDPTEAPAATATPEPSDAPEATAVPAVAYVAPVQTAEDQQINVHVDVPEGAFAENVAPTLHAQLITGETEEEQAELDKAAAQVAEQTGAAFDGMLALDVYFTDANAEDPEQEIEPALPVSVRFELSENVLPEGYDPATLAVHHLAEEKDAAGEPVTDENGEAAVTVETVANAVTDDAEVPGVVALSDAAAEAAEAPAEVARIADLPAPETAATPADEQAAAEAEQALTDPAVVAEFEVGSFSWFTLTYNKGNGIRVYLVDEDGDELWNGEVNFSDLSDTYNPTDFGEKYIADQWVSVEKLADTWASKTQGYNYLRAYANNSRDNTFTWIRYNTSGHYNGWRYSNNASGSGSDLENLYLVYEKVTETTPTDVTITDNVRGSGTLSANYSGSGSYYYVWEKSETGRDWAPIERLKMNGDQYNVTENGQTLNVVLEVVNDEQDNGGWWYRVSVYESKEEYESGTAEALATSAAMQLDYYDELRNGSFEEPSIADLSSGNKNNYQYPAGTEGLIWDTTGSDRQIEIVNSRGGIDSGDYHNDDGAQHGEQYAELNCEASGALYQDVMTVPGTELNWQFYHRARGNEGGNDRTTRDTMYLVIAPTDAVKNITTQDDLIELISDIQRYPNRYEGYYVKEVTSNRTSWHHYSSEDYDSSPYEVPEGQYLTRFFFVAGNTASGNAKVGNLLDNVAFTTGLLPAEDGEANLTVTKVVTGVSAEDMANYSVEFQVAGGGTNVTQTLTGDQFTQQSGGNYTATWQTTIDGIPGNGRKEFTVTETPVNLSKYDATGSTVSVNNSAASEGTQTSITLEERGSGTVTFTNSYAAKQPPEAPQHHKEANLISDATNPNNGKYELSLDVTGKTETETNSTDLNVLMIVDTSASMNEDFGWIDTRHYNKIEAVKYAAKQLVNTLENKDGIGEVYYDIVQFGFYSETETVLPWTNQIQSVNSAIEELRRRNQGTNWQAGIREGIADLGSIPEAAKDAKTCVIFLSDGGPSCALNDSNHGTSEDGSGTEVRERYANKAATEAAKMHVDYFYGIGADSDFNYNPDDQDKPSSVKYMEMLVSSVNAPNKDWFPAGDAQSLSNAFNDIIGSITTGYYDVTITDTLSEYVDFVLGANDQPQFTIKVTDADGNDVKDAEKTAGGLSVGYDKTTAQKKFSLEFNDDYTLKDGYTYTISAIIEPNQTAKDYYAEHGQYPDGMEGMTNTGTHSGQEGFWSNAEGQATVTYKHSSWEDELSAEYDKPVVQVPSVKLTIDKNVASLPAGTSSNAEYTFEIQGPNTMNGTYDGVTFTNGKATVTITGDAQKVINSLPMASYTVTETGTDELEDITTDDGKAYYFAGVQYGDDSEATNVTADLSTGDKTVTITNTYKPYKSLTIEKSITGAMASSDQTFTIEVQKTSGTLGNGDVVRTTEIDEKVTDIDFAAGSGEEKDKITITTKADGQVTLNKLRDGDVITITETNPTANGYNLKTINIPSDSTVGNDGETVITPKPGFVDNSNMVTVTMNKVTVEDDNIGNIEFVNERNVVTPTGLESNHTKPYALMVGAGALAGLALVGGILARRARRRREW